MVLPLLVLLSACDEQPSPLSPFYNYPAVEDNGIFTASPTSPTAASRYVGTHDRTYIAFYSSTGSGNGLIEIKYWDEGDKTLSGAVVLWSGWGYDSGGVGPGDDHASPSILVLQYQTGDNAVHNGKILVAVAEHCCSAADKGRCQTKRSTNAEDISAWDSAVSIETTDATYTRLEELNDGTIYLFYRLHTAPKAKATFYYRTSTDAGASWSARTLLADTDVAGESLYLITCTNPDHTQIHCMFNRTGMNDPVSGQQRYQDIYHVYYDSSSSKWKKMDGTEITVPLSMSEFDMVYSTTEQTAYLTTTDTIDINDSANYFILARRTASASGTVQTVRVKAGASGNAKVAIYADDSGEPGSLLQANNTGQSVYPGWNTLRLGGNISLTNGLDYWIGICVDTAGATQKTSGTGAGTRRCKSATYSSFNFPDFAGNGFSSDTCDSGLESYREADWTFLWDIKTDDSGNPYLVSVTIEQFGAFPLGKGRTPQLDCIVRRHNYSSGWQTEVVSSTGSGQFGTYVYPAGAILDDSDVDTIYLTPYDASKRTQLQKWQRVEGSWLKVEDITQSSPGWNFRPTAVRNGTGKFKVLWCYTERYSHFDPGYWESMLFAYPGYQFSR